MGAMSTFTTKNYPRQRVALYLFMESVNFSFKLEFKSDIIKDVSSAKMSHSFAAVEVLIKHTFMAFTAFLYVLIGSQGFFMLLLELLME